MSLSMEAQAIIEKMRTRIANGEFIPEQEMRTVIDIIREDRLAATTAGKEKRVKAGKSKKSSDELLAELEGL